ncbi:MAG: helix-turn-helix domain-containing protein [Erythrobacter sp.]|jgi:AraC-like DNA-binding protein
MAPGWEIIVRLVTIGAILLLLALTLGGEVRRPIRIALVGLLTGSTCYLLNSAPQFSLPRQIRLWIDMFSIFTPFWTWLFARFLFEREPAPRLVAAFVGALLASWFATYFLPRTGPMGFVAIHLVSLVLLADLFFTAWSGRDDDLIERRRTIRLWLPVLLAVQAGGILVYELVFGTDTPLPIVTLLNSLSILAVTVFAGSVLLQTDPELLVETVHQRRVERLAGELSPSEIVLKDKLEQAMAEGYWRTEGLTIATLANRLDTPEHRLRALINRRLGYRNFSAFLNTHRIDAAKAMLADRAQVDLPVLTIAMDLGYNSLPTFNRAFREITGKTPTDFRRAAIEQN